MNKHTLFIFAISLISYSQAYGQWTDNGSSSTTQDKIGINVTDPGSYWLNINGNSFINGNLRFPEVKYNGLTSQTVLSFPAYSDGAYFISRQLTSDIHEFILKMRDNTSGDAFKIWFDDYRGSNYDRTPLIVYGNKVALASDGGNVGIGTTNPTERLAVNGKIKAEEVIVEENVGADFVFDDEYHLPDLVELESFIRSNRHLPEIPTAEQMIAEGVKVGALQMKLLQKIEELTLYVIQLKKENQSQQQLLDIQSSKLQKLEN